MTLLVHRITNVVHVLLHKCSGTFSCTELTPSPKIIFFSEMNK